MGVSGLCMGSLDIESLFTNVPLTEAIQIVSDELFKDSDVISGFSKHDLVSMLTLTVKDALFTFDGQYYIQTDGVAMGSPLGPTLANAFLAFHEKNWLKDCPIEFKLTLYRSYVDDIFVLFNSSIS